MPLIRKTDATAEPLFVADVRDRLCISSTALSDDAVTALIKAARQKLEKQYGIAMINQVWTLVLDRFPGCGQYPLSRETGFYPASNYNAHPGYRSSLDSFEIPINLTPVRSISSVGYLDATGVAQLADPSTYNLIKGDLTSTVALANNASWPATAYVAGAVQIEFAAGFGPADTDVPENLKIAMCLLISHLRSLTSHNLFLSLDSVTGVGEKRYIVGSGSGDVIDAAVSSLMQDYVRPSL